METISRNEFTDTKTPNTVHGRPSLADGKVGRCVNLDGRRDYIDLGDQVRTVQSFAENLRIILRFTHFPCVLGVTKLRFGYYTIKTGKLRKVMLVVTKSLTCVLQGIITVKILLRDTIKGVTNEINSSVKTLDTMYKSIRYLHIGLGLGRDYCQFVIEKY